MARSWDDSDSMLTVGEVGAIYDQRDAATARAERAEGLVEMQRAILRRVRDLQARAEGYDFTIDPADLLAALEGTDNTGGTDG